MYLFSHQNSLTHYPSKRLKHHDIVKEKFVKQYSNNFSDTVNTIEYLLICLDCKYQTPYGYLWFAICDGREHVLTSEHKQVTITEIIWQNDKALEILRIEIKSVV